MIIVSSLAKGQTYPVTDYAPFGNTNMNMWGSGGALNLNKNIQLFRLNPNPITTSVGGITSIAGSQFGAQMNATLYIDIGANFEISGFEGGSIDVDYPVDITHVVPTNLSYERGEWITLQSDYTLRNTGQLLSSFPTGGSTELNFTFGFGTNVNARVCVFGCQNIPLLPPTSTTGILGAWPPVKFTIFGLYHDPVTNAFTAKYPCLDPYPIPNICNAALSPVPLDIPDLGISGYVDIPQTTTASSVDIANKCLNAYGADQYIQMDLDLLVYLAKIVSLIPGGAPIGKVIENLSNSYDLPGGANVGYNLFSAAFSVKNFNSQRFSYCPNVNTTLTFPTKIKYRVKNTSGTVIASGFENRVTYHTGEDIDIKYPCNYDFLDVIPIYEIDETENSFRNKTYDSLDFAFDMSALAFNITIPKILITPEINVPRICIPYPYPCPSWSKPWRWCTGQTCTPAFTIPAVSFGPYNIGFGPLWTESIPVGNIQIPWFDRSWPLKDMGTFTGTTIRLIPRAFEVNLTGTNILCKGDSTGSITANITNGTPPYRYEWGNSLVRNNMFALTDTWNNRPAGVYFLKVTDANGCSQLASITLTEPAKPLSVLDIKTDNVSCYANTDGKGVVKANGGTPPYTYLWSTGATTDSIINLPIGYYTVTITDANGCSIDTAITITQPDSLAIATTQTNVLCKNDSTGTANSTVTGGTFPYLFNWSNGETIANPTKLYAGNQTLTVTDLNGCIKTHTITITEPAQALAITTINTVDVTCKDSMNGSSNVTVIGGTSPYQYGWYNSSSIKLSAITSVANNISGDVYEIIVTDTNGCKTDSSFTINEPLESLAIIFDVDSALCKDAATGNVRATVTGGTINYSYNWSNGATTKDINNVLAGTYTANITDNNGCTLTDSVEVYEPTDSLKINLDYITDVLCFGESTGAIAVSINGGTSPYLFNWDNGAITEDIDNVTANNYTLTVTDKNGCTSTETYIINQPLTPLSSTEVITAVSCFTGNDGAIDVTPAGGTPPYSYTWVNQDSVVLSKTSKDATNLTSGTYTLIITDSNACTLTKSYFVSQPLEGMVSKLTKSDALCFGDNSGSVTTQITGGTIPYTFAWNNGATTQNLPNETSGLYKVTITDNNGCSITDSITINQPNSPLQASTSSFKASCNGGNDGKIILTPAGGTAPYTYAWSNTETTKDIDSLIAGIYNVTVTDNNGCTAFSGGAIEEPTNPINITFNVDSVTCFGYRDGHIRIDVTGGTTPYELQWADSTFLVNVKGNDIYNLPKGSYEIIVRDANNCVNTQTMLVEEPDTLASVLTKMDALCFGSSDGSINTNTFGGTMPYTYFWNDSITTPDRAGITAGDYTVKITDFNGCEIDKAIRVDEPEKRYFTSEVLEVSCRDEADGQIFIVPSGGTKGYDISWSNGDVGSAIQDLPTGGYTAYVQDANGCNDTLKFLLVGNDKVCIQLSNTITPNDDGINDTWIIDKMELYPNALIKIFNEWGKEVYVSRGAYSPWDGTFNGKPLPGGTYYYIIDLRTGDPQYNGVILIVK